MHYLHCILVEVADWKEFQPEALKDIAKDIAMQETEDFGKGLVFDWRADGPGSFADWYPDVVLGATDPDEFLRHLEHWKDSPLRAALNYLNGQESTFAHLASNPSAFVKDTWADPAYLHGAWALYRALSLVMGDYHLESGFYSVPDYSPKISDATLSAVRSNPSDYALVFLDYHN